VRDTLKVMHPLLDSILCQRPSHIHSLE